jgi:phage-related protein
MFLEAKLILIDLLNAPSEDQPLNDTVHNFLKWIDHNRQKTQNVLYRSRVVLQAAGQVSDHRQTPIHLTDRMVLYGPNLGMPHTKAIDDGLFELQRKSKEGIGRVFYCTLIGNKIVMLLTFI